MYFFERNEEYKDRIMCICDDGSSYTYRQVWDMGDELISGGTAAAGGTESGQGAQPRTAVVLQCSNEVESLAKYLAYLRKGCPVILLGRQMDEEAAEAMRKAYEGAECGGEAGVYGSQLGLLLSTSGSTGARKLVRLSYDNLQANCQSIVEYLGLTAEERPITTLPMEYTYGLSVIHSHLQVGATIVLTNYTFFNREFWEMMEKHQVTSIAGVPYSYEMLWKRLRLGRMYLPHLKTLTQAGGHLKEELQEEIAAWAAETGRRFFVMYGQTEATARMSYIPPENCIEKIGSIGIPVPGGRMELAEDGELIYYGDNVSLGYATCREDLEKGDENCRRLATGDMARVDEDGYFYIIGRKKRFVKLYGKRMSLDQIQDVLQGTFGCEDIVCTGDDKTGVHVWVAGAVLDENAVIKTFGEKWGIRPADVTVNHIDEIPRNTSGKIVYAQLAKR